MVAALGHFSVFFLFLFSVGSTDPRFLRRLSVASEVKLVVGTSGRLRHVYTLYIGNTLKRRRIVSLHFGNSKSLKLPSVSCLCVLESRRA